MTIEWVDVKGLDKKQIVNKIIEEKFDFVIDTNQKNERTGK
jgi:predicted O-linked N-acetylglucosamine transferase (SPINDLY family)